MKNQFFSATQRHGSKDHQEMSSEGSTERMIEVEPTDEGPRIRPKRQMSEAQLAALKRGRAKLAEKRKHQREEALEIIEEDKHSEEEKSSEEREPETAEESSNTKEVQTDLEEQEDSEDDLGHSGLACVVM
jgi:hypothetical protein